MATIKEKNNLSPTTTECGKNYQTFCKINGQTVGNNMTITYNNKITPQETINLASIWNEIQDVMKYIYNFGKLGTKTNNPNINNLNNQQLGNIITLEYYNDLSNRINQTKLTGEQYIKALNITNLQDSINNYKFNADRCNVCNNSCQYCVGCEGDSPCGDSSCDSTCCMVGNWGCAYTCETNWDACTHCEQN